MALHKHTIRNDRLRDVLAAAEALGRKPIATAMTWPLAQLKRTVRDKNEALDDAEQDVLDRFTVAELDKDGAPKKDDKGRPVPAKVYATNEDGSPRFKLDDRGNATDEREVKHGTVQLTDQIAYERELRVLRRDSCEIEVPHIQWPQLEGKLKECEPNIVEALMDFFDNAPDLKADTPRAEAKAARKKAAEAATT